MYILKHNKLYKPKQLKNIMKKLSGLAKLLGCATVGLSSLLPISKAEAVPINFNDSMNVDTINTTIAANPGSTFNFQAGTYQQGQNKTYEFLGGRDYTFADGTTIRGSDLDSDDFVIFRTSGSDINITGTGTVKLENSKWIGIFGGSSFYDNVHVSGITSETPDVIDAIHYEWENRKNSVDVTNPSIYFSNMVLINGSTGFHFRSLNEDTDGTSPYISVNHITADGLKDILVDVPVRDDVPELVDGQHYITSNALLNSNAVVREILWPLFNTPQDLAQENVTNPYINGGTNCFTTDDMMFVSGYIPLAGSSPLDLGGGEYIGAYEPQSAIPEPSILGLAGIVGAGLLNLKRKRENKQV